MELSNRQLIFIIAIALVITLLGTAVNLARLGIGPYALTGAATQSVGNVSVTINQQAAFNMSIANLSWGFGAVDSGKIEAYLDSEGPSVKDGNWSTTNANGFLFENTGNVDLNLTVQSNGTNYTATTFIGGTNPAYKYSTLETQGDACHSTGGTLANDNAIHFQATPNVTIICQNFSWVDSQDLLTVHVNMTIPYDSKTGYRQDTWIFTAVQRT